MNELNSDSMLSPQHGAYSDMPGGEAPRGEGGALRIALARTHAVVSLRVCDATAEGERIDGGTISFPRNDTHQIWTTHISKYARGQKYVRSIIPGAWVTIGTPSRNVLERFHNEWLRESTCTSGFVKPLLGTSRDKGLFPKGGSFA